METKKRVGARDTDKEKYWRNVLKQFGESRLSQAAFCKERDLNQNTFYYWKAVISARDAEIARSTRAHRTPAPAPVQAGRPAKHPPGFARFTISDLAAEPCPAPAQPTQTETPAGIAAEFIDASNGRRVRIFNGADQATVTALLSALTSVSAGRMGF